CGARDSAAGFGLDCGGLTSEPRTEATVAVTSGTDSLGEWALGGNGASWMGENEPALVAKSDEKNSIAASTASVRLVPWPPKSGSSSTSSGGETGADFWLVGPSSCPARAAGLPAVSPPGGLVASPTVRSR